MTTTPYTLTTKEVSDIFKCSEWKILMMVKSGDLKPIPAFGRPYRFDLGHIGNVLSGNSPSSLKTKKQVLATKSRPRQAVGSREELWQD
jgi:hypothetical protein